MFLPIYRATGALSRPQTSFSCATATRRRSVYKFTQYSAHWQLPFYICCI